jgi:uroporphyrinogen III methyltransferase/synthase
MRPEKDSRPPLAKVYLVGAGPGDPQLLTLLAKERLARADLVLYDYLVNPAILAHAPPSAELVCLGRHGHGRIMPQVEINRRMIDAARAGSTVVRLKAGDPIVFAHAAEELAALEAAGIGYEIVPGITAALAGGSHAGIPITHGEVASAVALITAQQRGGAESAALDYAALARFPGTLVFYMGATTARGWTAALVAAGKPADTPAAIVRRCTWPDQETIRCTLGEVAERIELRHLRPPLIVIVGPVVAAAKLSDWFAARPLFGLRVLVTRPREQAAALAEPLADLGADVLVQPAIEIGPPADVQQLDAAISRVAEFDWLAFSSSNGVLFFLDRLLATSDVRRLGRVKLAAMGPGTAEELARYRLRADVVPAQYRAEALAAELVKVCAGQRVLLVRASRGREVLAEELTAAGAIVEQVVAYESRDVSQPSEEVAAALAAGRIDWVTVTSSAIARSLARMFGKELARARLASISPITSATLAELGYQAAAEARKYTMAGVVRAIVDAQARQGSSE